MKTRKGYQENTSQVKHQRSKENIATEKREYKIILWMLPIESLQDNRQDIAGCKNIYNQCMHPYPLQHRSHAPILIHIHLWEKKKKNITADYLMGKSIRTEMLSLQKNQSLTLY